MATDEPSLDFDNDEPTGGLAYLHTPPAPPPSELEFPGEDEIKGTTNVLPSESTTTTTGSTMGGESEILQTGYQIYSKKFGIALPNIPRDILTPEMVQFGISFVGPALGTSQVAYLKLEVRNKNLRDISILTSYPHLRLVDLAENVISDLEPLANMKYLQVLSLAGNQIESVQSIPNFRWLQALNLSKNKISSVNEFQPNLIQYLNLSNNNLSSIDGLNANNFPNLMMLELRGNLISSIADIELPKLRHLYIAKNELTSLDGLQRCPDLELLHIRDNKVSSLFNFPNLEKLKYINLRSNNLSKFTETVHLGNSANLEVVILTSNKISSSKRYQEELCAVLPKLKRLDKMPVGEEELMQGRLLRKGRMKNLLDPLRDDEAREEFEGEDYRYGE